MPILLWQQKVVVATRIEDACLPTKLVTINTQPQSLSDAPHEAGVCSGETK